MAKIESRLYGDFDQILADLHDAVHTSISASLEGRCEDGKGIYCDIQLR